MIHRIVVMACCYPVPVSQILVAARLVAVAARVGTVDANPNA